MTRPKGANLLSVEKPTATIRFQPEEVDRVNEILERAHRRNPHASRNDVLKELMGFTETGLLSLEDRLVASGLKADQVTVIGRAPDIAPSLELPVASDSPADEKQQKAS